jgi:hypothetical protein
MASKEGGEEILVCSYCGRDENECERDKESVKNPVTLWCGGWGLSCDDCYYRLNPEDEDDEDDEDEDDEECTDE